MAASQYDLLIKNLDSHSPLDEFDPILCKLTIEDIVFNKVNFFKNEYKNRACMIHFSQAILT